MPDSLNDLYRLLTRFQIEVASLGRSDVSSQSDDMSQKLTEITELAALISEAVKTFSQGVTPSQQIAITITRLVIDSLIKSIETNKPKFNELIAGVDRSQAEAQVAQKIFNKFVFDSITLTILEAVSSGLSLTEKTRAALK